MGMKGGGFRVADIMRISARCGGFGRAFGF